VQGSRRLTRGRTYERTRRRGNEGIKKVPRMMTEVVPSPHSSSCVRLSSIMFFAAGCATSISRRMALPSFVILVHALETR
jgi:hypothetical protein